MDPAGKEPDGRMDERPRTPTTTRFRVALVVPTLDPGPSWVEWLEAFKKQTLRPDFPLVIDSASRDSSPELSAQYGFTVLRIERHEFVHGGTRQWAIEILSDADIVVFMTQDALFCGHDSLETLVAAFDNPEIAAAYGRQLPRKNATPLEAHARLFNYPPRSRVKSLADIPELGIKTIFCSNSFAAYRRTALLDAGGFPLDLAFSEDVYAVSKLVLKGWKIAYVSESAVLHSHGYSLSEEFRRYLSVGRFYGGERWILKTFGTAKGEGEKFVISEMRSLWPKRFYLLPSALLRTAVKLTGYQLGKMLALLFGRKMNG